MAGARATYTRTWMWVKEEDIDKTLISPGPLDKGVMIYQFRISLPETDPEVWRRVEIPGDFTISQLGRTVVRSIGWIAHYQYRFCGPDREHIVDPSRDEYLDFISNEEREKILSETKDATKIKVCELYSMEKKWSTLELGADSWTHLLELEKISDTAGRRWYPKCIAGKNACPPEDCGGASGYENLKEAIRDPKHEEHDELKEWLVDQGYEKFNPKKFKVSDVVIYD